MSHTEENGKVISHIVQVENLKASESIFGALNSNKTQTVGQGSVLIGIEQKVEEVEALIRQDIEKWLLLWNNRVQSSSLLSRKSQSSWGNLRVKSLRSTRLLSGLKPESVLYHSTFTRLGCFPRSSFQAFYAQRYVAPAHAPEVLFCNLQLQLSLLPSFNPLLLQLFESSEA